MNTLYECSKHSALLITSNIVKRSLLNITTSNYSFTRGIWSITKEIFLAKSELCILFTKITPPPKKKDRNFFSQHRNKIVHEWRNAEMCPHRAQKNARQEKKALFGAERPSHTVHHDWVTHLRDSVSQAASGQAPWAFLVAPLRLKWKEILHCLIG